MYICSNSSFQKCFFLFFYSNIYIYLSYDETAVGFQMPYVRCEGVWDTQGAVYKFPDKHFKEKSYLPCAPIRYGLQILKKDMLQQTYLFIW